MERIKELSESWSRKIDNKLTFAGVLEEFYSEISIRWKEQSTRHKNNLDYNNRILPAIQNHNMKPMDQYIKEDLDQVIAVIKDSYEETNGMVYQDITIQHYRYLIYLVVDAAVKNRVCHQILWGSTFRIPEVFDVDQLIDEQINEYVRLKKSFSPEEEIRILQEIFTDYLQRGEHMGLLLMSGLGLRNAEACGVNYGDIKEMDLYPGNYALWVYTTTEGDSNRLKASGKSKNADRVIPVYTKLNDFLMSRRAHLESLIETGQLQFPPDGEITSIDDLPVVCVGDDYITRCSAPDLTAAARELFQKVGLNEKQLAYIEVFLNDPLLILKEKEATAYLFRRNFATILHILGLEIPEIHYLIGHEIEDNYETRNEYVNEERLYQIKEKMEKRPIFGSTPIIETFDSEQIAISDGDCSGVHLRIPATPGILYSNLQTVEPTDSLTVQIHCKGKKNIHFVERHTASNCNSTINILETYLKKYN